MIFRENSTKITLFWHLPGLFRARLLFSGEKINQKQSKQPGQGL